MFKYKVSIYLKSGNIIYLRLKDDDKVDLIGWYLEETKNYFFINNCNSLARLSEIEAIIVKEWWQRWG
jgi:hypothetical protein